MRDQGDAKVVCRCPRIRYECVSTSIGRVIRIFVLDCSWMAVYPCATLAWFCVTDGALPRQILGFRNPRHCGRIANMETLTMLWTKVVTASS